MKMMNISKILFVASCVFISSTCVNALKVKDLLDEKIIGDAGLFKKQEESLRVLGEQIEALIKNPGTLTLETEAPLAIKNASSMATAYQARLKIEQIYGQAVKVNKGEKTPAEAVKTIKDSLNTIGIKVD